MSDNIARYDAYGNIMPKKSVPNMKQTEEKQTNKENKKISMPSVCYWCDRKVRSYYYIIDASMIDSGKVNCYGVVCKSDAIRCLLNTTFYGTIKLLSQQGEIYMSEEIKNDNE